jgi:hypothetical protein
MFCVSARFVALLGLRRPEQREQLPWPSQVHLWARGVIKASDGGGHGAREATEATGRGNRRTVTRAWTFAGVPRFALVGTLMPFVNPPCMRGAQGDSGWRTTRS